jgi:ABC-type multidrug transport system fused ATPase/permease subunit
MLLEHLQQHFRVLLLNPFQSGTVMPCAQCVGIGGAVLFVAYGQVTFWLMTSHRQTFKIRGALLRAVLRQDISWFDTHDSGGISTRLSEYV